MKKLLAMLLALCMIMSCMVFVVSAEGEVEHVAKKQRFYATTYFKQYNGGQEKGAVNAQVTSIGPGSYNVAGVIWQYNIAAPKSGKSVQPFDVSASTYLEFKLYMNQPEVLEGIYFDVEIRSWTDANGADREENNANVALSDYTENGTFEQGWNTVRIPLADLTGRADGECDLTSVKWIRFFNNSTSNGDPVSVPEGTVLDLMVKDVVFCTDDAVQVTVPMDAAGNWNWDDNPGSLVFEMEAGQNGPGNFLMQAPLETKVDLTGTKFVDIYCKITNAENFRKGMFEFEISSASTSDQQDVEELHYFGFLNNLVEGWQTLRIPMAYFTNGGSGTCDLSQIQWIRFFLAGCPLANPGAIEVAYVEFTDGGDKNTEVYNVTPGTLADGEKTEAKHNTGSIGEGSRGYLEQVSSVGVSNPSGFSQQLYGEGALVYKLALNYIIPEKIYLFANLCGFDCGIEVANKNEDSAYVPIFSQENPLPQIVAGYVFDLTQYVSNYASTGYDLYIRFTDTKPSTAGGYGVFDGMDLMIGDPSFTFVVTYDDFEIDPDTVIVTPEMMAADLAEMTAPEDGSYRPLFGCNVGRGEWEVDYKNYQAGSSSLTFTIGEWIDENGNTVTKLSNTAFQFQFGEFVGESSIDATGYDCLEFDFYISDVELFNKLDWKDHCFELTSSGTCDQEETGWSKDDLFTYSEGGEAKTGWNKVRLKLNHNNDTNLEAVNYIRFYFTGFQDGSYPIVDSKDQALTINWDNLRFTKYFAEQEAAARPVAEAMAQKIYDALKDIPAKFDDDNADIVAAFEANHETWKALYESLNAELNALDSIAQGLVSEIEIEGAEDDSAKMLRNLNTQLSKYQKYVEDQAKQPDPDPDPDPNPGDPDPDPNPGDPDPDPNPEDPKNPGDDKPGDDKPANNNTTIIIIVVVAVVVVVAAAVVAFIVIKKKKA